MYYRRPDHDADAFDDWSDVPPSSDAAKYLGGIVLALFLVIYGLRCVFGRHAMIPGTQQVEQIDFHGAKAIALGTASLSFGIFLHCHYYWGNIYQEYFVAVLGKIVGLIGLIGSLVYLIICTAIFGN
jgi:hypothetical protein